MCWLSSQHSLQLWLLHTLSDILWPTETNIQPCQSVCNRITMTTAPLITTPQFFFPPQSYTSFLTWQLVIRLPLKPFKVSCGTKLYLDLFFYPKKVGQSNSGQLCFLLFLKLICVMNCHHAVKLFFWEVLTIILLWPYCFHWLLLVSVKCQLFQHWTTETQILIRIRTKAWSETNQIILLLL